MKYDAKLILTTQLEILIPHYNDVGGLVTMTMEADRETELTLPPSRLVDLNLRLAGSSLQGARDSAALILGTRSKVPVVISRKHGMSLMPITWPDFSERGWVNKLQVQYYLPKQTGVTTVHMKSGNVYEVPCSYNVFDNSMSKARRLHSELTGRDQQIFREPAILTQAFHVQKGKSTTYAVTDEPSHVAEWKMEWT
ncbi:competence protein ComK [Sporosarcina koreensis]|uniref:competence protein ComK n=1 Tax=Sporosarcina koreensis TaxID=334735 RepID=UPI000693AD8B|nr:competence protein ComK [Sporosarcina koreensis]